MSCLLATLLANMQKYVINQWSLRSLESEDNENYFSGLRFQIGQKTRLGPEDSKIGILKLMVPSCNIELHLVRVFSLMEVCM